MSKPTTTLKTWRKKRIWAVVDGRGRVADEIHGMVALYRRKSDADYHAFGMGTVIPVIVTIEPVKGRKSK